MTDLEHLVRVFEEHGLTRLEYEQDGLRVALEKQAAATPLPPFAPPLPTVSPQATGLQLTGQTTAETAEATGIEGTTRVTAPLVGVVYRSQDPSTPPFVTVGAQVRQGDTLCLIEAMKLFNEITAPCDGTVLEIRFEDGELAEYGAHLLTLG
ncbi:MAG: acetyl-CoA carboxylase, biotin carboxyl carrier protein [Coriobacteriales bacterium]|jgi:acetyl-CoA carboxylase biotin carboxyl carrier protein|nr:acetyl-CoA carboxylase, biotin carboxyl carrier protein [Coriobacteriales bacterium]